MKLPPHKTGNQKAEIRRILTSVLLLSCLFFSIISATTTTPAHAACSNPTGNAGTLIYNEGYRVVEYCNGGAWVRTSQVGAGDTSTGLVGWWKLDDGAGTSAVDSSGNSNTGTTHNTPTWTTGMNSGALTFAAASSQYLTAADAPLSLAGSWTVSSWVTLSSLPSSGNSYELLIKSVSGGSTNYSLLVHNTAGAYSFRANLTNSVGTNYNASYTTAISTGT